MLKRAEEEGRLDEAGEPMETETAATKSSEKAPLSDAQVSLWHDKMVDTEANVSWQPATASYSQPPAGAAPAMPSALLGQGEFYSYYQLVLLGLTGLQCKTQH